MSLPQDSARSSAPTTSAPNSSYYPSSSSQQKPSTPDMTATPHPGEYNDSVVQTAAASDMATYIYESGFVMQNWADIQIVFVNMSIKLHRLILARSPYLDHLMKHAGTVSTIHLSFTDDNISEEAVYIAIRHLYNPSISYVDVSPSNARAVLATAFCFGGMPELVEHAYNVCASSISADNVHDYIRWLDAAPRVPIPASGLGTPNGFTFGSAASMMDTSSQGYGSGTGSSISGASTPREWHTAAAGSSGSSSYGEYSARLRADVMTFLTRTLPSQLTTPLHTDPVLLKTLTPLPYTLFKQVVESADLPIEFMQDRFALAKRAIAARKKAASAAAIAANGHPPVAPSSGQYEESVVLALKPEGDGMGVLVTRKPKRSRAPLWKTEG